MLINVNYELKYDISHKNVISLNELIVISMDSGFIRYEGQETCGKYDPSRFVRRSVKNFGILTLRFL